MLGLSALLEAVFRGNSDNKDYFAASSREVIELFRRALEEAGIETTVRFKRGQENKGGKRAAGGRAAVEVNR